MKQQALAIFGAVALVLAPSAAFSWGTTVDSVEVLGTVPNADTSHPSGLTQGDEWQITVFPGQIITLTGDTRNDDGLGNSGLDVVLILKDRNENVLASADDNVACSRPQVCGYACPEVVFDVPYNWSWLGTPLTVVVRDYNGATTTGAQCAGGSYNLRIEADGLAADKVTRSLKLVNDNGAVGDPPDFQEVLEAQKGQGL